MFSMEYTHSCKSKGFATITLTIFIHTLIGER